MTRESDIQNGPKGKTSIICWLSNYSRNKVIGVLAKFSTRRMQAADFEVLGVFSDQISKELEGLFTAVDFLIPDGTKQ